MSQMCQISFVGSSIRFLALALALSLTEGTKSKVRPVNRLCPINLLIMYCSFLFAVQNIELLFFSDRGAIIAILHCLSPLSDCLDCAASSDSVSEAWRRICHLFKWENVTKALFAGFCLHFLHNPIDTSLPFLCMLHKVCSALWLQNAVTKCQSVKMKAARQCSIITGRAINHRAWVFAPRFLINEKT